MGFFWLGIILAAALARAQQPETANPYVTVRPSVGEPPEPEAVQNAKESRPADDDPEGNWSEVVNGFQLSLRFETEVMRQGSPVSANILLRNISDTPREFVFPSGKGFGLCQFIITRDGSDPLVRIDEQRLFSIKALSLHPKTQWKWSARLNDMFKMDAPGSYRVTGVTAVGEPPVEIRTRTVFIQIAATNSTIEEMAAMNSNNSAPGAASTLSPSIHGRRLDSMEMDSAADRAAPAVSKSNAGTARPLLSIPAISDAHTFGATQKTGAGIVAGLFALMLAILWRAARRRRAG
jgi:hypothetical protein